MVTRTQLAADLRALGIGAGDTVLFHSSLKSVGWVEPGPEAVVEAFLDVVGPEGTIVVPTLVPALRGIRPPFDVITSPSEMGRLTEEVRRWLGARRSNHPTHSVAALGRLADELTVAHGRGGGPNTPWGTRALGFDSPWDRLRALDAWVLLIGVDFSRCTLLHHAQVRYVARHEGVTAKTAWPAFDFRLMGEALEAEGIVRRGTLGNAGCRLARAGAIVEKALALLESDPDRWFATGRGAALDWLHTRRAIEARGRPRAAGFKMDVTPSHVSRPVARPLHLRGLLLDHPQAGRAVLAVCDDGGFYDDEARLIRRAMAEASGIPLEAILLVGTHTHSGISHHWTPDAGFVALVAERAGRAAREAAHRLEPVRAGWTTIQAPGIRRNRTVYRRDGRAYTERWIIPSSWHVPETDVLRHGPDDDAVRVLVVERLDGTRLAVISDFSCHNSAGMDDPAIHDDFMGVAAELVERAEGHGCVVLCTPGSEGDQDPTGMIELGGLRDLAYAERLGRRYAGHILAAIQNVPVHDLFPIGTGNERVEVVVREDWRSRVAGVKHPELRTYADSGRAPAEVNALAVGDFALVGIPAEFFTTPARRIREHAPFDLVAVSALANGKLMYVAESDAFFDGSMIYGVYPQQPAMCERGTDRALSEAALRTLRQAKAAQVVAAATE
ncbi:MAG: AAC(3) family N-acetyltransferase [Chloroflexi bacterium]|nr:AAC(3) family N-acetyltransferase [Chloroflexota bacterium]